MRSDQGPLVLTLNGKRVTGKNFMRRYDKMGVVSAMSEEFGSGSVQDKVDSFFTYQCAQTIPDIF